MKRMIYFWVLFATLSQLPLAAAGKARQLLMSKENIEFPEDTGSDKDPLTIRKELRLALDEALKVYRDKGVDDVQFAAAVEKTKNLRKELQVSQVKANQEQQSELMVPGFAESMDRSEITLQELLVEWGPSDFVYLISPEIASSKIHIASNLAMPKECWGDLVEALLAQMVSELKRSTLLQNRYFL